MLRNAKTTAALLAAVLGLALAGCGGDDEGEDGGVRFAVYDSERQIGERVDDGSLRCGPPRALCPPALISPSGTYEYDPEGEPALDETAVAGATLDASGGEPIVTIELTAEGTRAFKELTAELADAGREAGRPHHAAVVVGEEIVALASVDYQAFPEGIDTPQIQFFAADRADAEAIAARINESG